MRRVRTSPVVLSTVGIDFMIKNFDYYFLELVKTASPYHGNLDFDRACYLILFFESWLL